MNLVAKPITSNPYGDHESREGLLTLAPTLTGGSNTERNHGKRSGSDRDPLVVADTVRSHVRAGSNSLGAIAFNWQDDRAFHAGDSPNLLRANQTEAVLVHSLRADGFDASEDGTGRGTPLTLAIRGRGDSYDLEYRDDAIANAILTPNGGRAGIGVGAVAFYENQRAETTLNDTVGSLKVGGGKPGQGYSALAQGMLVRRLTPLECERLQGFPDGFTNITFRGRPAADGSRYRVLGNSMAVPVIRWVLDRIRMVDELIEAK